MSNRALLTTGVVGSVIAAICCATPLLVVLLGSVGLSAWLGGIDYVVLPILVICIGITVFALYRRRTNVDTAEAKKEI
jgi:mercuric ion transport protein